MNLGFIGLEDPWIITAYLGTIASAMLCVFYGIINWNKGAEDEPVQIEEEQEWEKKEKIIEETL